MIILYSTPGFFARANLIKFLVFNFNEKTMLFHFWEGFSIFMDIFIKKWFLFLHQTGSVVTKKFNLFESQNLKECKEAGGLGRIVYDLYYMMII